MHARKTDTPNVDMRAYTQYRGGMTKEQAPLWSAYLVRVAGTDNRAVIAQAAGVHPSAVSRWLRGTTQPTNAANVAAFALHFHRSPLEAFVAAELLDLDVALAGLSQDEIALLADLQGGRASS